jgi:hypothetical protein
MSHYDEIAAKIQDYQRRACDASGLQSYESLTLQSRRSFQRKAATDARIARVMLLGLLQEMSASG